MSGYVLTPRAKADLRAIWSYIAADSEEAADRVENTVYQACEFLTRFPLRGHVRRDLTGLPLRFWTVARFPKYVIVYDPAANPLKIVRILHGARHAGRELKSSQRR